MFELNFQISLQNRKQLIMRMTFYQLNYNHQRKRILNEDFY